VPSHEHGDDYEKVAVYRKQGEIEARLREIEAERERVRGGGLNGR